MSIDLAQDARDRDAAARVDGVILLGNLRGILDEMEQVLQQAERFTVTGTWLDKLAACQWHLERTLGLLARAGGMEAVG